MQRLAIITTHPIQYNAPWFRLLAERGQITLKVFYTWSQVEHEQKFDPGFGKVVTWDIPLLGGYDHTFVKNTSSKPGSKSYKGIRNPTLIAELKQWLPDAILVFGWRFHSHLKAIRYFHKRNTLVLFRGDSHLRGNKGGLYHFLRTLIHKKIYKHVDNALYVGTWNKEYYLKAGVPHSRLVYAPHAVDNDRFQSTVEKIDAGLVLRKQLGIKEWDIVFLYAGKFEAVKTPMLLMEAAKIIASERVHFLFAGNGPLESAMKTIATPSIHFIDFVNQENMPALYQMCDVYVLPSKSETWGLAVNEAMAAGKAVLVSDACGCAVDLVEEGVTGYTFKNGDTRDLQQKLEMMAVDKNALATMGKKAGEKIKDWSFAHIAKAIERVMENIPDQSPE